MKKANYTLFQPQSWTPSIGKMALMMVFAWCCCLGIQEVNAQDKQDDFVLLFDSKANTSKAYKLNNCNGTVSSDDTRFTDDGSNDGLYADPMGGSRSDTIEICPKGSDYGVKVVFTDFDLEDGDELHVFQGNRAGVRAGTALGAGTGTGTGVSKAFGGWIDANCVNTSGCLTFVLETDGDNLKGSGWDAWVDCQDLTATLKGANVSAARLDCSETTGTANITYPTIDGCGTGTVTVDIIKLSDGSTCLANQTATSIANLPIGQYQAKFKATVRGKEITATQHFAIQTKPLVANDDLSIPLGEACMIQLAVDDILESPCAPVTGSGAGVGSAVTFMHYEMTIKLGSGPKAGVLTTTYETLASGEVVPVFPVITKQDITDAGMSICDAKAEVTIDRIYYKFGAPTTIACTPDETKLSVRTNISFKDISKPTINAPADGSITIVGCDISNLASLIGATAIDNCDDAITVTSTATVANDPCPATQDIDVVFTATDDCGNTTSTTRTYTLERPTELVKTEDVSSDCSVSPTAPVPGLKVGYRENGGALKVQDTVYLSTEDYTCGYILVKTQEDVPNTDCGSKTYEYFDLIDWCEGANGGERIDTTYIELTDKTAPVITGEDGSYVWSVTKNTYGATPNADIPLDDQSCTFDITKYAGPVATDACSSVSVRLGKVYRIEDGSNWAVEADELTKLDCDSFRLMWIAEDACHEQLVNDTSFQIVEIKDVTAPSAVCQDAFTVSVPSDEGARLEIGDIDGGSNDACGVTNREIRIKGSGDAWADHIVIDCEDVHEEVQVELRVTDKQGNTNVCWTTITAEDKIPPVCTNLEDESLTCKDIHTGELGASTDADGDGQMEDAEWQPLTGDLVEVYNTRFGTPDCEDNLSCGVLTIEQEYQLIEDDCGALRARRRYRANDWTQQILIWIVAILRFQQHQLRMILLIMDLVIFGQ